MASGRARRSWHIGSRTCGVLASLPLAADVHVGKPSCRGVLSGFLIVFVFSRIVGHNEFWKPITADGDLRTVARVVEETAEFVGYFILLVGILEYALALRQVCPRKAADGERPGCAEDLAKTNNR